MSHPQTTTAIEQPNRPSENELSEKAWELAKADNPNIDQGQRHLFFYPPTATPPPGEAGKYWRETIRGHWIKLAYTILTTPEEEDEDQPEETDLYQISNPTPYEVGKLAWELASEHIPSIPSHYRYIFLPRRPIPPKFALTDPWQIQITGFFSRVARNMIMFPERVQGLASKQHVKPLEQKRHDRFFPVRTPTMREVREKALAMALEDSPYMTNEARELFFYPEWVAPPPGDRGVYWRGIVQDHWFVVARNELQRKYNALPRVRMSRRKYKDRRGPNRYRFWTRKPLTNGPPQPRRRISIFPQISIHPAAPPDLLPTRPGAPPGRPWEEGTPACTRLPEEDRASSPCPPGWPGGLNSAEVMIIDNRIEIRQAGGPFARAASSLVDTNRPRIAMRLDESVAIAATKL
ncbi:MAG: hypothetical protein LUC93_18965 [Planctomycetaceae bacterium]|nr:hypothetical protein [Planctomycetaceae bacterium]